MSEDDINTLIVLIAKEIERLSAAAGRTEAAAEIGELGRMLERWIEERRRQGA